MDSECSYLDYSFINLATTESLLSTSQYAKVIFHNIEEKYDFNNDLICNYSLTKQFGAQTGDRIILFKLGWQEVSDYVLFEWVTVTDETTSLEVCFKAENLPRDLNEFYQLCYISGENTVCGASIPFQFTKFKDHFVTSVDSEYFVSLEIDSTNEIMTSLTESKLVEVKGTALPVSGENDSGQNISEQHVSGQNVSEGNVSEEMNNFAVSDIREENQQLRVELQETNVSLKNCDSQISELKSEVESLREMLCATQKDVAGLKVRMNVANEEYKKLFAEKARTEKKYEKLVKKCQGNKGKRNSESSCDLSSDFLGELEPLPPFPILM